MCRHHALEIGEAARALLGTRGRRWTVLASVEGATYLGSERRDVVWLAWDRRALHRRAVLVDGPRFTLAGEPSRCRLSDDTLFVGEDVEVDLAGAALWRPPAIVVRSGSVARQAASLSEAVLRASGRSGDHPGLLSHVAHAAASRRKRFRSPGLPDDGAVYEAITLLASARRGSSLVAALDRARSLVGLGAGLTPSGDDLLGGYLYALRTLDRQAGSALDVPWSRVEEWVAGVEPLTNDISFALLADHAAGEAGEPLTRLLRSASMGSSAQRLREAVIGVARVGHFSGWDLLAGVCCAGLRVARVPVLRVPPGGGNGR